MKHQVDEEAGEGEALQIVLPGDVVGVAIRAVRSRAGSRVRPWSVMAVVEECEMQKKEDPLIAWRPCST